MDRGCINRCGNMLRWDYQGEVCKSCLGYERQRRQYRARRPRPRLLELLFG